MDIIESQNKRFLCDPERLRILNLLRRGRLSIHDLSIVLGSNPRRLMDHLTIMEKRGLVISGNNGFTVLYRLPENPSPLLISNLQCLREVQNESTIYHSDLEKLVEHQKFQHFSQAQWVLVSGSVTVTVPDNNLKTIKADGILYSSGFFMAGKQEYDGLRWNPGSTPSLL